MSKPEQQLDIPKIDPPHKHPSIFETYNSLKVCEPFVIINDHNPKPLKYQMAAERGKNKFSLGIRVGRARSLESSNWKNGITKISCNPLQ